VPTFQRRELVQECVRSLARQRFEGSWEIIVVVDGSTDGTAEALRRLQLPVPLTVVEQPNRGLSAARNRGAATARGELVLFLDDDMEADPDLLAEHERSHREGADAVMGDMPMHPDSPATLITEAVEQWADERARRLAEPNAPLAFRDLLGGQLSVRREVIEELGGFDGDFTAQGAFGGEDIDFGYRLLRSGRRVIFNGAAVSRQKYVVTPARHLRQWRDAGRASVALVRKHPETSAELQELFPGQRGLRRWVLRPLLGTPVVGWALLGAARAIALLGVRNGQGGDRAKRLFFAVRDAERLRGTIEAGGVPDEPALCVLAYHAIEDLPGDPVLAPYGVPPDLFGRQLDAVAALGFRFVGLSEALSALRGAGAENDRLALVTFDDCYPSVLHAGLPALRSRGIPAVAFAVSARVGATNEWDRRHGAGELRLLDADGLRDLAEGGVEIGAHSRTHRSLDGMGPDELAAEVTGSVDELERLGLPRPRAFAYPHGEYDAAARAAVRDAGLEAAFTVRIGIARPSSDRFALPRIEITPRDVGWRLRLKLAAANAPGPIARRVARRSLR
jgi:GT2 family glycosyltransferase/peptidoglycan/xylan/chitin deacetylase (PgdA/CDA1 family)